MAVTLQQIAEAAGVSRGTVDRALNNRGRIRPEVEERIKRIAREMGYQPSRAGRALAMAKRKIRIGVILQYMETPFMQQVLNGVLEAKEEVESFGGTVKIYEIEGVEPEKVMAAMEELREEGFNGIDAFFPILRQVTTLEEAMDPQTAQKNMESAVEQVFRVIRLKERNW